MKPRINQLEVFTDIPEWPLSLTEKALTFAANLTGRKVDFCYAGPFVEPNAEPIFEPDELEWGPALDRGWRDEDGGVEELCL